MPYPLLPVSRIILSSDFSNKIYTFSEKYSGEHFKVFREKWDEWQKHHSKELEEEIKKIQDTGIQDSPEEIIEKIYISARYYSKKRKYQEEKKQKQKQNQRQKLPPISKKIKSTIKEFIQKKITNTTQTIKPCELYREYCKSYIKEIYSEINSLRQTDNRNSLDPQEISLKFKKAFHNYLYRNYCVKND
jgi:hypothetical protein